MTDHKRKGRATYREFKTLDLSEAMQTGFNEPHILAQWVYLCSLDFSGTTVVEIMQNKYEFM